MKNQSFTRFTRDVIESPRYVRGEPYVIPAGGQPDNRTASALLKSLCKAVQDAQLEAKVDRATELVERIAARRSAPIPDAKNAGPSVQELFARSQYIGDARARAFEEACRRSEAAYAARNPHKRASEEA